MKAIVNKDLCIGCGACAAICPEEFEINDDGLSESLNEKVNDENISAVKEAVDNCPTSAISTEE